MSPVPLFDWLPLTFEFDEAEHDAEAEEEEAIEAHDDDMVEMTDAAQFSPILWPSSTVRAAGSVSLGARFSLLASDCRFLACLLVFNLARFECDDEWDELEADDGDEWWLW